MWTIVLNHLIKNWVAYALGAAVIAGYLYVTGLQAAIERRDERISALEVKLEQTVLEAKRQADAFTFLEKQFQEYQLAIGEYIRELTKVESKDTEARDVVRETGKPEDRNTPVVPYISEVLKNLCKVYPSTCPK
jgi:septal ring factor EnvC (AmiA/AmiB activator)